MNQIRYTRNYDPVNNLNHFVHELWPHEQKRFHSTGTLGKIHSKQCLKVMTGSTFVSDRDNLKIDIQ